MLRDTNGREPFGKGLVAKPWEVEKSYQFFLTLPSLPLTLEAGNDDSDRFGSTPPLLGQPITGVQGGKRST